MDPVSAKPSDYLRPIWRLKWIILIVTALVTAGVYKYFDGKPRIYSTFATLYVGPTETDTIINGGVAPVGNDRALNNEAELLVSPKLAEQVAKDLKLDVPPEALLGIVKAVPNNGSDFIELNAKGSNPKLLADVLNGFGAAYIKRETDLTRRSNESALQEAQNQLSKLRAKDASGQAGQLATRIADLQSRVKSPQAAAELTASARVPTTPDEPKPVRSAVFGGALALILGIIAAFLFDRADRRVRQTEDMEELYGVPVLATVPKVRRPAPVSDAGPFIPSELQEAHRTMRVNLELAVKDSHLRSLLVTSAIPGEGKSTVARNLAFSYRDAGREVIVLEADLRRPSLGGLMGVGATAGLSEVLVGAVSIEDALQTISHEGQISFDGSTNGHAPGLPAVRVLTAGNTLLDPTTVLTVERLEPLMNRLFMMADLVIIDSPPVLSVGDTLPLLSLADAVLLVARRGVTTSDAALRLRRTLDRLSSARLVGTVISGAEDEMAYGYGASRPSAAATVSSQ